MTDLRCVTPGLPNRRKYPWQRAVRLNEPQVQSGLYMLVDGIWRFHLAGGMAQTEALIDPPRRMRQERALRIILKRVLSSWRVGASFYHRNQRRCHVPGGARETSSVCVRPRAVIPYFITNNSEGIVSESAHTLRPSPAMAFRSTHRLARKMCCRGQVSDLDLKQKARAQKTASKLGQIHHWADVLSYRECRQAAERHFTPTGAHLSAFEVLNQSTTRPSHVGRSVEVSRARLQLS